MAIFHLQNWLCFKFIFTYNLLFCYTNDRNGILLQRCSLKGSGNRKILPAFNQTCHLIHPLRGNPSWPQKCHFCWKSEITGLLVLAVVSICKAQQHLLYLAVCAICFKAFGKSRGGSVPVCCQTLQVLIWKTEHVFVWVPCGFLQLCIPAGTVEGGRVLQRYFSHCQGAHRSAGILLNSKLPLIRWVFKEKPGGHVGNTLGSCIIPLLVPVNKNIAKIRTGDMAVD